MKMLAMEGNTETGWNLVAPGGKAKRCFHPYIENENV